MNVTITRRARLALAGGAIAVAAAGVSGVALGAGSNGTAATATTSTPPACAGARPPADATGLPAALDAAAADYIGVTPQQVRQARHDGTSLSTLATQHGKTADGLTQALLAAAKTQLDAAVSAGKITAAAAATRLSQLTSHIADLISRTGPPGPGGPPPDGTPPAYAAG
jgi:hypothetical protein